MAEDMGDKTEAPTSKRLTDARAKGQIPKSQDLVGAVDLIGAVLLVAFLGGAVVRVFQAMMQRSLSEGSESIDIATVGPLLRGAAMELAIALTPILGGMVVVAIVGHIAQSGFVMNFELLQPKFDRLNPMTGLKRVFGTRGASRSGINSLKLVAVLWTAWDYLVGVSEQVAGLPLLTAHQALYLTGQLGVELALRLLILLLFIGAIDFIYQRWQHTRDLRMTKHDVKDERRSMDGDPQLKGKRLQMMREFALQRIHSAVPRSTVVVTNPTHYSVAIEYDSSTMRAPRVTAKGVDYLAMRIREVAISHSVPILERPPLARSLYANVEVGQEISAQHYEAVAEVLAYVYRLETQAA